MIRVVALLFLGAALVAGIDNLTPPTNLMSEVTSTGVMLTWDELENVTFQVTIENVTDQNVQENEITISGLQPKTTYTAMIKSVYMDQMSMAAEITFTTAIPPVQNLMVTSATESSIELEWDEVMGATSYRIMVTSDSDSTELDITSSAPLAVIEGLSVITFYDIKVTPEDGTSTGDAAMIRERTDGSGIVIDGIWRNAPDDIFGGQIMVYRPLEIPKGSYSIEITIPCSLESLEVWNADVVDSLTDISSGFVVVTQRQLWQRRESVVGMNFNFAGGQNCSFGVDKPVALFGVDIMDEPAMEEIDVPAVTTEWLNVDEFEVFSAGLVRVRLMEVFNDVNMMEDDKREKPDLYTFAIAVNPGDACPGGLMIGDNVWSMSRKNTEGIVGTQPGSIYFVQEEIQWYSNEAGFIYGYNPENCPNRGNITAEVMIGGNLVQAIVDAPMAGEEDTV